jgi:hypothetical protein
MFRKMERDGKRRNTVSDEIRDDETEATEEVEGHGFVGEPTVGSPHVPRSDDEGEDVEGHGFIGEPTVGSPHVPRSDDEGDDVEAHGMINEPTIGQPNVP